MKKIKFLLSAFIAATMAMTYTACSDDSGNGGGGGNPGDSTQDYHFDLFMSVGKHGGMGQGESTIVRSVSDLTSKSDKLV